MGIIIRKAFAEDAFNYADCHISCFRSAYKGIVPDDYLEDMLAQKEKRVEHYKATLAAPGDCEYYCVMHEGKMVGFNIINKRPCDDGSVIGEIWAIYLLEEYRGKGYGKEVLDFAITELKRVHPKEIFLWVFEDNHRARRFYEKNGLSFDGTKREMTYSKPLVQFKYALNLAI